MKHAVSIAMTLLLLGMPLSCILNPCAITDPCRPRTDASVKCPYDTFDAAKLTNLVATVSLPVGQTQIEPEINFVAKSFGPSGEQDRGDLHMLHCILRI